MHKRTKQLQFDKKTIQKIIERDQYQCLFCILDYHMPKDYEMGLEIKDIMHIVPKSAGGLGIEKNGVLGCRYHHSLLDNGNQGLRYEMMQYIETHMLLHYPDWDKEKLYYKKN